MSFVENGGENYFAPFKKHEAILNNKSEPFENKLESLIDIWKTVSELNLSEFDIRHVIQIMDWAKLHALNIVLTAEWNGFKDTHQTKLIEEIEKAQNQLYKLNDGFATRCKKLADVVKNPWEDPVLMKLMKTKDAEIGPEEIEFFCVETAYLVSVRLKKLCESHCEDLALNLVTAFMNCKNMSKEQNFNLNLSETQMWFIFDIYIALLYKFQDKQKIVVLLKELSFEEGLHLIKRFAKKRVKISKIWKNCQRVAVLALQMYISQAVVKYSDELKDILKNYLEIYLSLCNTDSLLQDFTTSIRRISNLADASGLYLFCDVVQNMAGSKLKPFVIEMYIRALTCDMNDLERQKDAKEDAKAEVTTSRLAAAFCSLAEFLSEHVNVAREGVLTAFSLEPTKERLKSIEEFARKSGFKVLDTGQEWKCKLHPPVLPSDEITWICSECGDWMCKPQLNLPKINMTLNEALQTSVLGISEALCDDLVVCLSNPRYQILSWFLPWDDLHRLCIMYLQDPQTTKNFVTELKFVDIDYSIFKGIKKEPVDELAGIERGYEQYLDHDFVSGEESSSDSEDSMSQDSRPYSLGSDGAGESLYVPLIPVQQKSDPNTLKSLRMFRHNLKRKEKEQCVSIPEKISKQESSSTITSNTYRGLPETTSLSRFLNGVPIGSTPSMLPPQDPDSKNVKTATLPLLGGQVAKNEIKSIQVHLQNLNTQKLLGNTKTPTDQALKPYNQSTSTNASSIVKKELTVRILNKPLLSGFKENNSCSLANTSNSKPQISSQFLDIKTYTRVPQKNKEVKLPPTLTDPTTHINPEAPVSNKQEKTAAPEKNLSPQTSAPVPERSVLEPKEESIPTQKQLTTQPIFNSCQRTQPVDIKYRKKSSKQQATIPQSQCNSSKQEEPVPSPLQAMESRCNPDQAQVPVPPVSKNTQNNPEAVSNPVEKSALDIVDLTRTATPERLSPNKVEHTLSSNLMAKQRIQAIVDRTLPSVESPTSPKSQTPSHIIVDLTQSNLEATLRPLVKNSTMPVRALAAALARAREYQETREIAESLLQATGATLPDSPPRKSPTAKPVIQPSNLKNKVQPSNSTQIDQKKSQPPAKKVKTADKAVNTCQELYQIQKAYLEKAQALKAQKKQQTAQKRLPTQEPPKTNPQKEKEKPSTICSPISGQHQIQIQQDSPSSICSPKLNQTQSEVTIKGEQFSIGTPNFSPQESVVTNANNLKHNNVDIAQKEPLSNQKTVPLICPPNPNQEPIQSNQQEKMSHQDQSRKEPKNPEKQSTSFSHRSPKTVLTKQVLPNSSQRHGLSIKVEKSPLNQNSLVKQLSNNKEVSQSSKEIQTKPSRMLQSNKTINQSPNRSSLPSPSKALEENKAINQSQEESSKVTSPSRATEQNKTINQLPDQRLPISLPNKTAGQNNKILNQSPDKSSQTTFRSSTHSPKLTSPSRNRTPQSLSPIKSRRQKESKPQSIPIQSRGPLEDPELSQNTHQDNPETCQIQQQSDKSEQPKSYQSKKSPQPQDSPQHCHTPLISEQDKNLQHNPANHPICKSPNSNLLRKEQESENLTPHCKSTLLKELLELPIDVIKSKSTELLPDPSNRLEDLSKELSRQSTKKKRAMNSEYKRELSITTEISNQPPSTSNNLLLTILKNQQETQKVDQQKETSVIQNQSLSGSSNLLKVRSPSRSSDKQLSLPSPQEGQNNMGLQSLPCSPKETCPPLPVILNPQNVQTDLEMDPSKVAAQLSQVKEQSHQTMFQNQVDQFRPLAARPVNPQSSQLTQGALAQILMSNSTQEDSQKKISCTSLEATNEGTGEIVPQLELSSEAIMGSDIEKDLAEILGEEVDYSKGGGKVSDSVVSDIEEELPENNNNYSCKEENNELKDVPEEVPKNSNLTDNNRMYAKKLDNLEKGCVQQLLSCKNVNSSTNIPPHSSVQNVQRKNKELKVVLCRLLSSDCIGGEKNCTNKEEYSTARQKSDRGKSTSPRSVRRRKSFDKSENKSGKTSNTVQNHNISPLQDINPRVTPKTFPNSCCDLNKSTGFPIGKCSPEKKHPEKDKDLDCSDKKNFARSVLANIPGLNDFEMIRPSNVDQIVNVVQVSGGRVIQNGPIQNTQTSTQVTPHIQRIGQPRVSESKTEHTTATTTAAAATVSTVVTTTKATTATQPSTLINILSQQVIRPVTTQANVVRRTPMINILSQQIIRPMQTPKTTANVVSVSENQTKPVTTTAEQTIINPSANVTKTTATVKSVNTVTPGHGGTILQFICKSSLPKFQQAFGKTVYQNNTETVDSTTSNVDTGTTTTEPKKTTVTKAVPVNVQPIQGSVIYSRQVPVGQTISLIPPGGTTRQVFRIATSNPEQLLVKDSVIHSKMSALLAAALQGRAKTAEGGEVQISCDDATKVTLTRPTLVQNARIVKPVQLQLPTNVVRTSPQTNLSSTTLEQLREFDMVYKQIKERSSTSTPADNANNGQESQEAPPQRISVTYVNQLPKYTQLSPVVVVTSYSSLQPAASPALSVTSQGSSSPCLTPSTTPTLPKITSKTSKGKTLKTTVTTTNTVPVATAAKSSPSIPKPQQKPQEDEHTTQRIFDILAEYAEQLRNSPDLNNKPAPRRRSNPPTNPSQSSKRKKSSSSAKKSGQSSSSTLDMDADDLTVGSEDSSGGNIIQLSVTDDEQSQAATITTPESNENSSSSSRQIILTESAAIGAQPRNVIIADSSVGEALKMSNAVIVPGNYIMPVSMVKGGQPIAVVSGGSKILATVPARSGQNMLLLQSFTNQNRKGAISAVKYSTIQPISGISSHTLAGVSAQPPVILPPNSVATAVALGQPLALKKIGDDKETGELVLTISSAKEPPKLVSDLPQPDSSTNISADSTDVKMEQIKLNSTLKIEQNLQSDITNEKIFQKYQKTVINSVGTSVIATALKQDDGTAQSIVSLPSDSIKVVESKQNERMQSVLVTACSSNGPMLSHTTPRYRKPSDSSRINNDLPAKEEYLHNGDKCNSSDTRTFRGSTNYYSNKLKKSCSDSQKVDSDMQKQAAIERELRLQKSLSEECEDLGVDEPSTSDLFPEADLLFDSNHSPSFDQTSQDMIKRTHQAGEIKEVKSSMNLFSDDETSSSLRTDLFEYVEYQPVEAVEAALSYQERQFVNGSNTCTESGSSGYEDNTLLPKCATMSEVTLNSPISPEMYQDNNLNKYKFKYTNRKKSDKIKQCDLVGEIVSSSEDTVGSTEIGKSNCEDDNVKIIHIKEDKCELHCQGDRDSPSGRGARRSVRKLCSCCNGSQAGNIARKRPPTSRPHTPAPHKKAFLTKKR